MSWRKDMLGGDMPEEKVSHSPNCIYDPLTGRGNPCSCGAAADAGPRHEHYFGINVKTGELVCAVCAAPPVPQEAAPQPPSVEWSRNHLAHVQRFLVEMYQTMVDPCDEFKGNIAELCELLLKMARDQREREHERMTKADLLTNSIRFSEQATAPDSAMRVAEKIVLHYVSPEGHWTFPSKENLAALIRQAGSERERQLEKFVARFIDMHEHGAGNEFWDELRAEASRLLGGES